VPCLLPLPCLVPALSCVLCVLCLSGQVFVVLGRVVGCGFDLVMVFVGHRLVGCRAGRDGQNEKALEFGLQIFFYLRSEY
jgi:hypothetical protein